ncbi:MAG: hypothetical protein M1828_005692 [Chrysothrix sp. TS-e1954]|nr:MAG: hypothetical protein M1828_005692 [Chrysothrix sp. TS-e1954]
MQSLVTQIARESILVKPLNTPITPLCTSLTTLTWENVRNAGDFRTAIQRFESFNQQHLAKDDLQWAFVTLDSWDLRVQLPREARDKSVVLPLYMQHSRAFDLRSEYQRWQSYHPESLPFGSSQLSNICAALEVEPVQTSAPIKHNLPFHLQALAPASPRRAMEEAITLSRVLSGLIRKSQPTSQHPDVLTRPMDANADVRAFLAERSKVLHMSGLPHDTTQSELESWFTQFGGRPIAFWTLKTPDQHKPTGTGFAVFSAHEEAAESLCMNGRALNEKAIEGHHIQSHGGPMDYAYGYGGHHMMGGHGGHMGHGHGPPHMRSGGHGNVVPFRAGDWKCGSDGCGYHNFAKNVSCLRCGASRATAAIVAESGFSTPMDSHANYGMHTPSMAGTPGPAPYGAPPGGYGAGAGFHGQHFGGPPSTYALPSNLGAGGPPYPPMGGHFGMGAPPSVVGAFDSRAEHAFTSAGQTPSSMPQNASNGSGYTMDGASDPFSFLSSGLGGLSISDDARRNPSSNAPKQSS